MVTYEIQKRRAINFGKTSTNNKEGIRYIKRTKEKTKNKFGKNCLQLSIREVSIIIK